MLRRPDYDRWHGDVLTHLSRTYLHDLAAELLAMGAAVAGFKLGEMGVYLRAGDADVLRRLLRLPIAIDDWANVEVYQPAFQVEVVGTTGAGDSAYAGLLAAMRRGMSPAESLRMACAAGAHNVEAFDSNSGIRHWEDIQARIGAGWPSYPTALPTTDAAV